MSATREALTFPASSSTQIDPYLPPPQSKPNPSPPKPHLTLTYAHSLDSSLSLAPSTQTPLSGPASKAMTHYLRAYHAAILIGAGTAAADDPSLNCRLAGVGGYGGDVLERQPRPVVLDPRGRWDFTAESKVMRLAREGRGLAPWVFTAGGLDGGRRKLLRDLGGGDFVLKTLPNGRFGWDDILRELGRMGIGSVMVEGGGSVINELLSPRWVGLVDAAIVTIAPVWLGEGGVQVCPEERRDENGDKVAVGRLVDVRWVVLGEDIVLCGRPKRDS